MLIYIKHLGPETDHYRNDKKKKNRVVRKFKSFVGKSKIDTSVASDLMEDPRHRGGMISTPNVHNSGILVKILHLPLVSSSH